MSRRSIIALACIAVLFLSSCGNSSEEAEPVGEVGAAATGAPFDPDEPIDQAEADQVVLDEDDLDPEFEAEQTQGEDNSVLRCMAVIDDLEEFGPTAATHAERIFAATEDQGQERLFSGVSSYDSVTEATEVFAALKDHVDGCGRLTDKQDGFRWVLDTRMQDDAETDADERVDLFAEGSVRYKKQAKEPYIAHFAVGRVGNTIITVALLSVNMKPPSDAVEDGFETSLERLIDVRGSQS